MNTSRLLKESSVISIWTWFSLPAEKCYEIVCLEGFILNGFLSVTRPWDHLRRHTDVKGEMLRCFMICDPLEPCSLIWLDRGFPNIAGHALISDSRHICERLYEKSPNICCPLVIALKQKYLDPRQIKNVMQLLSPYASYGWFRWKPLQYWVIEMIKGQR